ncbi:DUF4221 family protein [Dokdonia ponticola]|uniref:DUF4221 family protein n=1 Tax=Dokdonia ponticola TaxID=2041041 RepID=A0ABV9HYI5_9FLAO
MKKNFFLLLCIINSILLGISCDHKESNAGDFLSINKVGEISIPIDQQTNQRVNVKLNNIEDTAYLSFFNPTNYAIYIYNFEQKEVVDIINLDKEGPNGINLGGQLAPGYFIHTLDSIFVIGQKDHYLINNKGEVLIKGRFGDATNSTTSVSEKILSFNNASYFKDKKLYSGITSYVQKESAPNLQAVLPVTMDTILSEYMKESILVPKYEEILELKEKLRKEQRYVAMGLSFERNKECLYASTPVSDTVYIFKDFQLIKKVYTGTNEVTISSNSDYFDQFRNSTYKIAREYPFYKDLMVNDEYLYRVLSKGNTTTIHPETQEEELTSKGDYLIVYNLKTDQVNHLELSPNTIRYHTGFTLENKLYFKLKEQPSENNIRFGVYEVK